MEIKRSVGNSYTEIERGAVVSAERTRTRSGRENGVTRTGGCIRSPDQSGASQVGGSKCMAQLCVAQRKRRLCVCMEQLCVERSRVSLLLGNEQLGNDLVDLDVLQLHSLAGRAR